MSLIEEIGELSLVCASLKAENEELRELVKDANEIIDAVHMAVNSLYGRSSQAERAPMLPMIEAWQVRAKPMLERNKL